MNGIIYLIKYNIDLEKNYPFDINDSKDINYSVVILTKDTSIPTVTQIN